MVHATSAARSAAQTNATPPAPATPRRGFAQALPALALALTLLLVWEIGVRAAGLREIQLPAPSRVVEISWAQRALIADHALATMQIALIGLVAAVSVGVGFGLLIASWPLAERAVYPLLVFSQTIPTIAIAPLLVLLFGLGALPKVIVVALVCFFPITVNLADGLRGVDPLMLDVMRALGASPWQVLAKVKIPAALPAFFSGLKVATTYCVIGAVLGEWIAAPKGLGVFMLRSFSAAQTAQAFAGILAVSIITIALFSFVLMLERLLTGWHYRRA